MGGALLMANQNVAQPGTMLSLIAIKRVIDRQHRPAGIAKQGVDALVDKGAYHHFRTRHAFSAALGGWIGRERRVDGHGTFSSENFETCAVRGARKKALSGLVRATKQRATLKITRRRSLQIRLGSCAPNFAPK